MSAWASQRKLYIAITCLVVIAFMVSGFVILVGRPRPPQVTCSDGIRNGLEGGIDCGGECPKDCPKELLDLWTRVFRIAPGVYAAVAYVENQNKEMRVPEVQFEINLYDEDGKFVTRDSSKTSIMPDGVTPIFVPYILTGKREAKSASFRFTEEPVFKRAPAPREFAVSDMDISAPEGEDPGVSALVTNEGKHSARDVEFVVIVYDEDDVAIAASKTFEEFFMPGESRRLRYTWTHPIELREGRCPGGRPCVRAVKRAEIIPVIKKW